MSVCMLDYSSTTNMSFTHPKRFAEKCLQTMRKSTENAVFKHKHSNDNKEEGDEKIPTHTHKHTQRDIYHRLNHSDSPAHLLVFHLFAVKNDLYVNSANEQSHSHNNAMLRSSNSNGKNANDKNICMLNG